LYLGDLFNLHRMLASCHRKSSDSEGGVKARRSAELNRKEVDHLVATITIVNDELSVIDTTIAVA
jgi:hypothetical protein